MLSNYYPWLRPIWSVQKALVLCVPHGPAWVMKKERPRLGPKTLFLRLCTMNGCQNRAKHIYVMLRNHPGGLHLEMAVCIYVYTAGSAELARFSVMGTGNAVLIARRRGWVRWKGIHELSPNNECLFCVRALEHSSFSSTMDRKATRMRTKIDTSNACPKYTYLQ